MVSLEQPGSRLCSAAFEFYAPAASDVFLVGEFNDWDPRATPMQRGCDGNWRVETLPAGFHRYKFVVDSIWRCSHDQPRDRCARPCEACPRCVPNVYGSFDRIAVIA